MEHSKKVNVRQVQQESLGRHIKREWKLYAFMLIPIIYFIIFKYLPLIGNVIAFRTYRGGPNILGTEWVGLRYFKQFFSDKAFWRAFRNTLTLSFSYLLARFPLTIIFALLINEIQRMRFKKVVQTVSYLPHFVSMVILAGMIKEVLATNGPVNNFIVRMGGDAIPFLSLPEWFPTIYVVSGVWQGLGWGTILYLAAMAGINTELYEAARVDGANRFRQAWHVTLPGILPTITTILILDIGGLMGSNFEKVLLLYSPLTYETADVISTYVYRMGIGGGQFSYATAVGLFEGLIGLVLVLTANTVSKKVTENALW